MYTPSVDLHVSLTGWVNRKLTFCLRCTEQNIPFHLWFVCMLTPFNETQNFCIPIPSKGSISVSLFACCMHKQTPVDSRGSSHRSGCVQTTYLRSTGRTLRRAGSGRRMNTTECQDHRGGADEREQ